MPAAQDAGIVGARQGCTIGIYTREKGYELSISFTGLGGCTRFEWLGEHGQQEHIRKMRSTLNGAQATNYY